MKIHYGTSIPPGLVAPTHGELKVKVERLVLEDVLLNPTDGAAHSSSAMIPTDHCGIQVAFWGELSATTAGGKRAGASPPIGVPSTEGCTDRGVQCFIFPVKTLERQLVQYFRHMAASDFLGMHLRVVVPAAYSGKREHTPVGLAVVDLQGLSSEGHGIHGWFAVHRHAKGSSLPLHVQAASSAQHIGKVKVHISLVMFASPTAQPAPPAKSVEATGARVEDAINTTSQPPIADHPVGERTSTENADHHLRSTMPPCVTDRQTESSNHVNSTPLPRAEPSMPIVSQQDRLREWFQRGVELREQMSRAASTRASSTLLLPSIHSRPTQPEVLTAASGVSSSVERILLGLQVGRGGRQDDDMDNRSNSGSDDDEDLVSSSSSASSSSSTPHRETVALPAASVEPQTLLRAGDSYESPVGLNRSTLSVIPFRGTLSLELRDLVITTGTQGLMDRPSIAEIRVGLRLSSDVDLLEGQSHLLSSYVHPWPLQRPDGIIQLHVTDMVALTTSSRVTLELFSVVSKPVARPPVDLHPLSRDRKHFDATMLSAAAREQMLREQDPLRQYERVLDHEVLVGLCVVDICSLQQKVCAFVHPLEPDCRAQCLLRMELLPQAPPVAFASSTTLATRNPNNTTTSGSFETAAAVAYPHQPDNHGVRFSKDALLRHKPLITKVVSHHTDRSHNESQESDGSSTMLSTSVTSSAPDEGRADKDDAVQLCDLGVDAAAERSNAPTADPPGTAPPLLTVSSCVRLLVSILEVRGLANFTVCVPDGASVLSVGSVMCTVEELYRRGGQTKKASEVTWSHYSDAEGDGWLESITAMPRLPTLHSDQWGVEATVEGYGTCSKVVGLSGANQTAAEVGFEAILRIDASHVGGGCAAVNSSIADIVAAIDIGIYGVATEAPIESPDAAWANASPIGAARVDLTALKYLSTIDGWFKVVSASHAVETTVGCVRISVRKI